MKQTMDFSCPKAHKPAVAVGEIVFVILCVLVSEWAVIPLFGRKLTTLSVPILIILCFGMISHLSRREKARELGVRVDNFASAVRLLLPMMCIGAVLLVVLGLAAGGMIILPRINGRFFQTVSWLLWWGFLQQYALQAIINRRAQLVWGQGAFSIIFVASVFALLHLPNTVLVVATFAAGCVWAYVYQRAPNLFALAISHCLMTLVLVWTFPSGLLHKMRVGFGYFN